MTHIEMLDKIIEAKNLLDSVYYNVSNNKLSVELENSLSVADSCILNAIDLIDLLVDNEATQWIN